MSLRALFCAALQLSQWMPQETKKFTKEVYFNRFKRLLSWVLIGDLNLFGLFSQEYEQGEEKSSSLSLSLSHLANTLSPSLRRKIHNFSNLLSSEINFCFPWRNFSVILPPGFLNLPISQTSFCFPWSFKKTGLYCSMILELIHCFVMDTILMHFAPYMSLEGNVPEEQQTCWVPLLTLSHCHHLENHQRGFFGCHLIYKGQNLQHPFLLPSRTSHSMEQLYSVETQ